jgi:3-methyladenine DNA glycosylase AlkD
MTSPHISYTAKETASALKKLGNPSIAEHSKNFFKALPGGYGEGDEFLGIRVPNIRKVALRFKELPLGETEQLLHSKYHEGRLCALIILVNQAKGANEKELEQIFDLYLNNTTYINNWDLVDTSAEHIVGAYLTEKNRSILYELAISNDLWERRIAIMSTFHFIKNNDFTDTLGIAEILLTDKHDLIHKAVGWMLREVGKRDIIVEEEFLTKHVTDMPRTMLRYAIEKFPEPKRQLFLKR